MEAGLGQNSEVRQGAVEPALFMPFIENCFGSFRFPVSFLTLCSTNLCLQENVKANSWRPVVLLKVGPSAFSNLQNCWIFFSEPHSGKSH